MFLTFSPTSALSLNFFFQAEDGIRDADVTGVQTCALPISSSTRFQRLYQWTLSAASAQNRRGSLRHRAYTWSCVLGIALRLRAAVASRTALKVQADARRRNGGLCPAPGSPFAFLAYPTRDGAPTIYTHL